MDNLYEMRPAIYMTGLTHLIEYINESRPTSKMDMIEIGSYAGESTELFCKSFKKVVAIDPYLDNYDENDITCQHAKMSVVLEHFQNKMIKFDNIGLIKATSDDAIAHDLILGDFDFVYIDGMHTYEQVKKDIKNFIKLIKPGGFIGGHDYHPTYQGVIDAVHEELGEPDEIFIDTSWIKRI